MQNLQHAQTDQSCNIDDEYSTKIGFENQIENLKIEIQKLNDERERGLQRLKVQPFVGSVLIGLLHLGLDENDIIKVAERCHNNLSNRTSYTEVLRREIINTIENFMKIPMENASLAMRNLKNNQ